MRVALGASTKIENAQHDDMKAAPPCMARCFFEETRLADARHTANDQAVALAILAACLQQGVDLRDFRPPANERPLVALLVAHRRADAEDGDGRRQAFEGLLAQRVQFEMPVEMLRDL